MGTSVYDEMYSSNQLAYISTSPATDGKCSSIYSHSSHFYGVNTLRFTLQVATGAVL